MKYSYLLLLLCLFAKNVWAQNDDYFEDVDIRGAQKAQIESLWSLSGNMSEWKGVVYDNRNGWQAKKLDAKVSSIKIPPKTTIKKRTNSDFKKNSSRLTSTVRSNFRHGSSYYKNSLLEINRQNAAIREAERKRQRVENQVMQAVQYNAMMSAYRASDNQRIVEKIVNLNQVHAMDYANVPQGTAGPKPKTLSNQGLVDLLKSEEETTLDIEVEFIEPDENRENKRSVSIGQDDCYIDLFDDGGYNQEELKLWEQALSSDEPLVLPDASKKTQQYKADLLIEKGWLDLDSFNITTLPDMGCVALIGDSILLLDNDSLPFLKWSVESNICQVISCGTKTIGKRHNQIVEIKEDGLELFCELEDEDFNIYPETDSTFIICASIIDLFIVTRMNVSTKKYDELIRTQDTIRKVVSNGTITLALMEDRIIDFTESPKLFYLSLEKINDLCMCKEGLLVATDKKVFLLMSPQETCVFTDEGASRLWCDGTDIYLIDNKGDLIRYSKK